MGFNPRAREGRDPVMRLDLLRAGVSIHAPARGATSGFGNGAGTNLGFQSTRPRGARRQYS